MIVVEICKNIPTTTARITCSSIPKFSAGITNPRPIPRGVIIPKAVKNNHDFKLLSFDCVKSVINAIATGI